MSATTTFEATHSVLLREFFADRMRVRHQKVEGEDKPSSHVITVERLWDQRNKATLVFLDHQPDVRFQLEFPLLHSRNGRPCTRESLGLASPFVKGWNAAGHEPGIRLLADARKATVILEGSMSPYHEVTEKSCTEMLEWLRKQASIIRKGMLSAQTRAETPTEVVERTYALLVQNRTSLDHLADLSRRFCGDVAPKAPRLVEGALDPTDDTPATSTSD